MIGRLHAAVATALAALALAGCDRAPPSPLEPVDPLVLYPAPRYLAEDRLGIRVAAAPSPAFDSAVPPDLPPPARAAWDAGGSDRYVVIARYGSGRATVRVYGESDRAGPTRSPPRRRSSTPAAGCTSPPSSTARPSPCAASSRATTARL